MNEIVELIERISQRFSEIIEEDKRLCAEISKTLKNLEETQNKIHQTINGG